MQAAAATAARRRLRQGLGLVVYRCRAAPQAVGDSEKTEAAAHHGEAAARLPQRAVGARRPPEPATDPDQRAVARYLNHLAACGVGKGASPKSGDVGAGGDAPLPTLSDSSVRQRRQSHARQCPCCRLRHATLPTLRATPTASATRG